MASAVATPLEKQFTTIAGLDSMTSTSALGSTQITLQFDLSRNIDSAALDVQSAITSAANQLPPNMPSPPTFRKVNPADSPVLFLALTSTTLPLSMVDEYAETLLGQQISMVPGVAQVGVFGSMKYAVRIQVDPGQLAARRSVSTRCSTRFKAPTSICPWARSMEPTAPSISSRTASSPTLSLYRPLIVAYRNGAPVRLHEVATVADSVQDNRLAGWINGEPGIILSIQRQPGTNTIAVVDGILKLLPRFRSIMPPAMHLTIEYDRSISIRESVNDVKFTLLLAICLVVLVIFLFLRNLSATVIPSLAVPMSIVGTFAVMYLLGYTIDNLSLLALTLSVGFVVDDAIVMLENVVRHMEQGKDVREAAFEGSQRNRFHHYLDDPVPGGGLPAGLLHGRNYRAAAPRICRRDCFRGAGFGLCFADPHPDALQPLPACGACPGARVDVSQSGERSRGGASPLRLHAALGAASSRGRNALRGRDPRPAQPGNSGRSPRASFPRKTRRKSTFSPRRVKAFRSTR